MRQVLQSLKSGQVELTEIPTPIPGRGQVLIQSTYSLVSLGTERMLLEFGKAGWLGKAQQQPEKVRQVVQKLRTDGIGPTLHAVQNKLDRPIPLGYCNVGRVIGCGPGVLNFKIGDRVASNGPHAEVVCVGEHLCARIPDSVSDSEAAFAFVAAIGLQGVRLLEPTLGETVVVLGLGLIGLLSVQILRANGCRVMAFDFDSRKVEMAKSMGASSFVLNESIDPVQIVTERSHGLGCDAVLITASTSSNMPVRMAPKMCRVRGRVSLVGVCDLDLSREDFYKKEIRFQVSCSYGPGRYDTNYEQKGLDYPIGFVRWTEERNVQAILSLMEAKQLDCTPLITEIVDFDKAPQIYDKGIEREDALGLLFKYPTNLRPEALRTQVKIANAAIHANGDKITVGVLGAGNFVGAMILPILAKSPVQLRSLGSKSGVSAEHLAKKFSFAEATSEESKILTSPDINTVIIATPHHCHARQVLTALKASKNVFVEKPLALHDDEITDLEKYFHQNLITPQFLVGFNRRFAPVTQALKQWLGSCPAGASFVMTVNAGAVDRSHWTQDRAQGGGRLIGEGCHFVDLLRYLADSPIVDGKSCFADISTRDTFSLHLKFASGSIGVINYFSNGHKDLAKERLEVFYQNQVVLMDNFKSLTSFGAKGLRKMRALNQNKGHAEQFRQFFARIQMGGPPLIPIDQLLEVARWCLRLDRGVE